MLYDIRKASYSPVFYDERDFLDINVPLGTIIDKTIVHPHRKQFFFMAIWNFIIFHRLGKRPFRVFYKEGKLII